MRSKLWKQDTWPERKKISFGRMLSKNTGGDENTAKEIDEMVEADYRDNL